MDLRGCGRAVDSRVGPFVDGSGYDSRRGGASTNPSSSSPLVSMSSGYYPSTPSYFTSPRLSIPSVLYPTSTSNSTFQHSSLQVFVGSQPSPTYPSSLPSFNDQRFSPSQGGYSHTHTTPHPHPHPHLHPLQASPPSSRTTSARSRPPPLPLEPATIPLTPTISLDPQSLPATPFARPPGRRHLAE